MPISIHQLDDGAWLSVNDERVLNVSDLWWLARHEFCSCEMADFLAEGFVEIGADPPDIEGRIAGQCIECGQSGVTGWLTLGRVLEPEAEGKTEGKSEFFPVDPASVHVPNRRRRLAVLDE